MRFMMLVIPPDYTTAPPDATPDVDDVARMTKYNEELMKAGILLALDGLHPQSAGVRVTFNGGKATAKDGPFAEAKEAVGGYWLIQVKSKEEAVEWAMRCPMEDGAAIEVRQVQEFEEFPQDVQDAAAGERELLAQLERKRTNAHV